MASDEISELYSELDSEPEAASSSSDDSEGDDDGQALPPASAAKRRRLAGGHPGDAALAGLDLITACAARQGVGSGCVPAAAAAASAAVAAMATTAADIDGSQEAEASLLQLEVGQLLQEARPELGAEAGLLALLHALAAMLRALPEAEVAAAGGGEAEGAAAAALRGFLRDLAFQPVVRLWGGGLGEGGGCGGGWLCLVEVGAWQSAWEGETRPPASVCMTPCVLCGWLDCNR